MTALKKICYVSPNAHLGGAERIIEVLLRYHDRSRFQLSVVFFKDGPLVGKWKNLGVETFVTPPFRLRSPLEVLRACRAFKSFAEARSFDAIHSHLSYGHLISTLALRGNPALRFWFQHGPISRGLDTFAGFLPASLIFFNSQFTANQQLRLSSTHSRVVLGPVETPLKNSSELLRLREQIRNSMGISQDRTVLLHVARMDPWKGQSLLLETFAKVRAQLGDDVDLVFFGDASMGNQHYFKTLQNRAAQADLKGHVHFAGFETDLEKIYSIGDVFVHASTTPEPLGLSVIEAQIRSLPVIAVDAGGVREIVTNQTSGLLYASGDQDALATAILEMCKSPPLRLKLVRAGVLSAGQLEASSWTAMIETIYDELLESPDDRTLPEGRTSHQS